MEIRISKPNEICEEYLSQIIDLIVKVDKSEVTSMVLEN